MNPRAHEAILRAAFRHAAFPELAPPWVAELDVEDLACGDRDEDVHIVPWLGWRLRSAGLTHTYRPGRARGELLAPSALARARVLLARGGARNLGRVAHLLVDTAVPARSRGVWHLAGDPFEEWAEAHAGELAGLGCADVPTPREVSELFESLAGISVAHEVDTSRTVRGWLGRGVALSPAQLEAQARVLIPQATGHVAALLRAGAFPLRR